MGISAAKTAIVQILLKMLNETLFCLFAVIVFARAGHWEEWMVYRKECGTMEKRCVADSPNEIYPTCEHFGLPCGEPRVYYSWEEASKIDKTIYLKIGEEVKRVPVMISVDGKKYLIFQRRLNGEVDFYRNWNDYIDGFGNPEGEYWIGLRALNVLTASGKFDMTVFLQDFNNVQVYARYGTFEVDGPETYFKLKVGDYSGTAGDAMTSQNNMMFSTQDQDRDVASDANCAVIYHGAWWYSACHSSNLNGKYYDAPGNHTTYANGVNWQPFLGYHVSMKKAVMALSLK